MLFPAKGRQDPKGRGKGLEEGGFIGVLLYLCCVFLRCFVVSVLFNLIWKTFCNFFLKKTDLSNTDLS